jgi:hypothetical protein
VLNLVDPWPFSLWEVLRLGPLLPMAFQREWSYISSLVKILKSSLINYPLRQLGCPTDNDDASGSTYLERSLLEDCSHMTLQSIKFNLYFLFRIIMISRLIHRLHFTENTISIQLDLFRSIKATLGEYRLV